MANNDDVKQADQAAPAADIPDLKKKEKERKKTGAAWDGAKPGGGSFSGAAAGARSAASAASATSAVGGAASGAAGATGTAGGFASFVAGISSFLAGLTATVHGKVMLAAGVAVFLAGAGLFGYAILKGGDAGGAGAIGEDLGAISSSMKILGDGGDRTGYIASKGEIMFDPLQPAEAQKAAEEQAPEEEEQAAEEPVLPAQTADAAGTGSDWNRPGLDHNLSGSKLSSNLGGDFGDKNIFVGNSFAAKFNEGMGKVNIQGGQKGRLSSSRNTANTRVSQGGKRSSVKANKAFGQLRVAKGMSALSASDSIAEGASSTAADAFDETKGSGLVAGNPGLASDKAASNSGAPSGTVDTPSNPNGAPDMTSPDVTAPVGVAVDPNGTEAIAGIAATAKQAGELKKTGIIQRRVGALAVIAGLVLIRIGLPWMVAAGLVSVAAGLTAMAMGAMTINRATQMKDMADSMSEDLAARTGDIKQDKINKYCIDQAYDGADPKNCNPPDSIFDKKEFDAKTKDQVQKHENTVSETGRVEGSNGKPIDNQ